MWARLDAEPAGRTAAAAAKIGFLARDPDSSEVVWEIRDYQWLARGHVSRRYPEKVIRTWKTPPEPFYGYFGLARTPDLWLVEDPVSAARIALAGGNALALLGTRFSTEGQQELGKYLARLRVQFPEPRVRVALDPDAASKGLALTRELTNRLGCDTIFVPMVADPKDLRRAELERILRT